MGIVNKAGAVKDGGRGARGSGRESWHCYRVDQLGDSLWPLVVSWRASEPSASMIQIWREPPRVDSKTMWRPSGAQLGRSVRPASRVISRMLRLAASMM